VDNTLTQSSVRLGENMAALNYISFLSMDQLNENVQGIIKQQLTDIEKLADKDGGFEADSNESSKNKGQGENTTDPVAKPSLIDDFADLNTQQPSYTDPED
jgi:hypothetical protein